MKLASRRKNTPAFVRGTATSSDEAFDSAIRSQLPFLVKPVQSGFALKRLGSGRLRRTLIAGPSGELNWDHRIGLDSKGNIYARDIIGWRIQQTRLAAGPAKMMCGQGCGGFFTGSSTTIRNVAIGPRNKEINHQRSPLRPLAWAKPAFMSERVNQPTAYSGVAPAIWIAASVIMASAHSVTLLYSRCHYNVRRFLYQIERRALFVAPYQP